MTNHRTNKFRRLFALILALAMALGVAPGVLAAEADDLLDAKSLPTALWDIDPATWYDSPLHGLYEVPVTVGGALRPFHLYVPDSAYPNQPVVHILIDSDAEAAAFLADSGWQQISEDEAVILTVMTAEGDWGGLDVEYDYINTSYDFVTKRPFIDVRKHNMYLAAYGDAADVGLEFALKMPHYFAGILSVGSTGMRDGLEAELNTGLSNFYDSEGAQLTYSDVVYPAWIVSQEKTAAVDSLIEYFKGSNRTEGTATPTPLADLYYAPDEDAFPELEYEAVGGVYYSTGELGEYVNHDFSLSVWRNMFECIRRYPSFGEVRSYIPSDEDPLFTRYDEMVYGGDVNGQPGTDYHRFWYVYQPETIQDSDTDIPVVFVLHGNGGGPSEITDQTGWKMMAEELGAILVAPQGSASWGASMSSAHGVPYRQYTISWTTSANATRPNDLLFIDYLMNWLTADSKYAEMIDASRVFVTGQSMGGSFTGSLIANRPHYFAAAAPASWVSTPGASADLSVDIPVINVMGQRDTTISGGFGGSSGRTIFNHYLDRYQITERGGLERTYDDFDFMVSDPENATAKDGMLNQYIFETANGYPMFEAVEVVGMGHATVPTAVRHIWEMFFAHYTRDTETGVLYYDGEVVDTPVNLELAASAALSMSTTAHNVQVGDFIPVTVSFTEEQPANTVILNFTFDAAKFRYNGYSVDKVEGVTLVDYQSGEGWAKVTLMAPGYDMEDLGYLGLVAKEDAVLARERQYVNLTAEYVLRDENGDKSVAEAKSKVSFTTGGSDPDLLGDTNEDGVVDILDLSNMVDWFGYTRNNQTDWDNWYSFFDFNNNGEIDISDIVFVARLI